MNIWTVEQGEYSDYSVLGVFSTKENAERVAALVGNDAEVVERQMDPHIEELNTGRYFYLVFMQKDGTVTRVERGELSSYNFERYESFPWVDIHDHTRGTFLMTYVWATDDVHAVKIVNERRTVLIALDKWSDS